MGIPVILTATNIDAPIIASIMASICTNSKAEINFHIIDCFLSHVNKQRIEKCKKIFNNFTINYIRLDLRPWLENYPELVKFNRGGVLKYVIPSILTFLDKAILLDNDVIFLDGADIKDLYETDLLQYTIAAVPLITLFGNGLWSRPKLANYEKLGLSSRDAVFDPAMILVDIKRWNDEKLTEKILDITRTLVCQRKLSACYDGMFKLFDGKYLKLDKSWNVPYHYAKIFCFGKKSGPDEMKALHFNYSGDNNKPWNNKELEGSNYFWKYASMTVFKAILENNPPSRIHNPQYWSKLKYRRKIINLIIKILVNRKRYRKLKKHAEQFFADSKSRIIRCLGELYF